MRGHVGAQRIAVVGSGISGLTAAAELHRAGHLVHLFEAGDHLGGHANTVEVEDGEAGRLPVDTGFIVFNDRNYPNFVRLLDELGVESQPANMSFSVADGEGGFEWATRGPRGLFARPGHVLDPQFHRMLRDLVRFNRDARRLVGLRSNGPSLRRFLADGGYSEYFIERLLVPQVSAVWSADPDQLWSFPAAFLAEFFNNHGALQLLGRPSWRAIRGGSRRYVEALAAPFRERAHVRARVQSVRRFPGFVRLSVGGESVDFDQVVLALHSDQALRLLADASSAESEILRSIPYQRNEAVLHTDASLMPRRRSAWASWNYHLDGAGSGRTTVTYDMNRLQSLESERRLLVSMNRANVIDPERVIRVIDYAHPVFTPDGVRAQSRWEEISGVAGTHYCGAYWRWGFHEDGAWSGLRVAHMLGGRAPLEGAGDATPPSQPVASVDVMAAAA